MLKTFVRIGAAAAILSLGSIAHSQAMPTATGAGGFQVGVGATLAKPDFGDRFIGGYTIFGDYNLSQHLGIEGDVHILNLRTPADEAENMYEAGPRFTFRKKRFIPYGKVMIGYGSFYVQEANDNVGVPNASSFMFSFGGGVDIDFKRHITVRAFDFEYQKWTNFLNHGLSPAAGTVGVAYRFH